MRLRPLTDEELETLHRNTSRLQELTDELRRHLGPDDDEARKRIAAEALAVVDESARIIVAAD